MVRRTVRLVSIVLAVAVAGAGGFFALAPAAHAATGVISGTVACRNGKAVSGVWVHSSAGGSNFASWSPRSGAPWIATYSRQVTLTSSSQVRLDVGCGSGTTAGSWWSYNSTPPIAASGSRTLNAICNEASGARAQRCAWWGQSALIGAPFTGYWDRFGYAPPATHPRSSADWATDIYQAQGTAVKLQAFAPSNVNLTFKVSYRGAGCSTTDGPTVRVAVYWNGTNIGWLAYSHLASVPSGVSTGASIGNGAILGYTRQWTKQSCYQVSNPNGVHTHLGAANVRNVAGSTNYSCYAPLASGTQYPLGRWIGIIGANNATNVQRAC